MSGPESRIPNRVNVPVAQPFAEKYQVVRAVMQYYLLFEANSLIPHVIKLLCTE